MQMAVDPKDTCETMLSCLLDTDGDGGDDQMLAALKAEMEIEDAGDGLKQQENVKGADDLL